MPQAGDCVGPCLAAEVQPQRMQALPVPADGPADVRAALTCAGALSKQRLQCLLGWAALPASQVCCLSTDSDACWAALPGLHIHCPGSASSALAPGSAARQATLGYPEEPRAALREQGGWAAQCLSSTSEQVGGHDVNRSLSLICNLL